MVTKKQEAEGLDRYVDWELHTDFDEEDTPEEPDEEDTPEDTQAAFDEVVEAVARGEFGKPAQWRLAVSELGFDHREVQKALVRRANPR